jgi:hypothetical protein
MITVLPLRLAPEPPLRSTQSSHEGIPMFGLGTSLWITSLVGRDCVDPGQPLRRPSTSFGNVTQPGRIGLDHRKIATKQTQKCCTKRSDLGKSA